MAEPFTWGFDSYCVHVENKLA